MNNLEQRLEQNREFHMWEPLKFSTPKNYEYIPKSKLKKDLIRMLHLSIKPIFDVLNTAMFGLKIEGERNLNLLGKHGAISISNHIHVMDCTMLAMAVSPHRNMFFMSLEANFKIPVINKLIKALGAFPLPTSPHLIEEMISSIKEGTKDGSIVHIYPEEIMHMYRKELIDFHTGAFKIAADNNIPILPIIIKQRKPKGLFSLYKHKNCFTVKILPPIFPNSTIKPNKERKNLQSKSFSIMNAHLKAANDRLK